MVDHVRTVWQVSIRRACQALSVDRSTHYPSKRTGQAVLIKRIKEIAETRVRYGYRRIHVLLGREGWRVNVKRVYRAMGLAITQQIAQAAGQGTAARGSFGGDRGEPGLGDGLQWPRIYQQRTRSVGLHARGNRWTSAGRANRPTTPSSRASTASSGRNAWTRTGSSASTRRGENARLGVETTTRCAHTPRSATKCLRRFMGRPAIPASPPSDEAGIFQPQVVQGWGQVQINPGLSFRLDEKRGSRVEGL
jgi:hypothetical protein